MTNLLLEIYRPARAGCRGFIHGGIVGMFIDPKTKEPTRVGYKIEADKKTRISKKSGEEI